MIHLHPGKTRPHTQVLALSLPVLPAPITHTYCTLRPHDVLTHMGTHTNTQALSAVRSYDTERSIPVGKHPAHQTTRKSAVQMRMSYILRSRLHLFAPSGFECHVCCIIRKQRCCLGRASWPTRLPITADERPAPSDWQADSRHLHPAPAASPLAPTTTGYFGWML